MLCPVAVAFMPEKEISGYDFSVWFYQSLGRTCSAEISAYCPTVSRETQFNRISNLCLEFLESVDMAAVEMASPTDLERVRSYQN